MQHDARIELHDDHRTVVELVAVQLDRAARRGSGCPQLVLAVRLGAARGTLEMQAIFEARPTRPTAGEYDARFGIRVDAAELFLCAHQTLRARPRRAGEKKIGIRELRAQHGG